MAVLAFISNHKPEYTAYLLLKVQKKYVDFLKGTPDTSCGVSKTKSSN